MAVVKVFYAILFLVLVGKGLSQDCPEDSISIEQTATGNSIHGKPEFLVTVLNQCDCPRQRVTLDCKGFQTTEEPNQFYMMRLGDDCLLLQGEPIEAFGEVDFLYAWDTQFPFKVRSSSTQCS